MQTVFLRLLRRETSLSEIDSMENYLSRSAINASLDLVRSRREAASIDTVERTLSEDTLHSPERASRAAELRRWLRGAVSRLHPTAAEMFSLRYFEDLDNLEIASLLGTSQAVVAVTLHRARTRLKQDFVEMMGDPNE